MSVAGGTRGEARVGVDFNPSGDGRIDGIKRLAAQLIDRIGEIPEPPGGRGREVARLKALAEDGVEGAAMWAVKAAARSR